MHFKLRTKLFASFALTTASLLACSSGGDSAATAAQKVTSIPETAVTNQGETGSCWLYATANWVESLHTMTNGNSIHFSPGYWLYWELYDQLVGGSPQAEFGGYWGWAGDIIQRYGLMPAGAFAIDDVGTALSAVNNVNLKLSSGVLGPLVDGGAPRDPRAVRAVLDEAFKLGNDTRGLLTSVFGADGTHTFRDGATAQGSLLRAQEVSIATPSKYGLIPSTLDQALGAADPKGQFPDDRVGTNAWTAAYPPTTPGLSSMFSGGAVPGRPIALTSLPSTNNAAPSNDPSASGANPVAGMPPLTAPDPVAWRAFYKRIQRALNDGVPVMMAFSVIDSDVNIQNGRFAAAGPIVKSSRFGGHEVLITDYEINNVPGFGTLPAGQAANPAQKAASLDDNASISFFRVKNSWGTQAFEFASVAGYNDIETGYLEQPIDLCDDTGGATPSSTTCWAIAPQIWDAVLPPGY